MEEEEAPKTYFVPSKQPWVIRLLLFIVICSIGTLLTSAVIYGIGSLALGMSEKDFQDTANLSSNFNAFIFLQGSYTVGVFLLPPLVFGWLMSRNPLRYLKLQYLPKASEIALGLLIMLSAYFLIPALIDVMKLLPTQGTWIQKMNDQNTGMKEILLQSKGFNHFSVLLLAIALLPAIAEEFFFRGVLMQMINERRKSIHLGVLLSGFLFAATHLEVENFLAMWFLGSILGYVFLWSGTLWTSIILHFLFNGSQILLAYIMYNFEGEAWAKKADPDLPLLVSLVAGVVCLALMVLAHKKFRNQTITSIHLAENIPD